MLQVMADMLRQLDDKIADLDKEIAKRANADEVCRRLMTIPGIGPIAATALVALAPPAETFRRGHGFAAWLGLTPVQKFTGARPAYTREVWMESPRCVSHSLSSRTECVNDWPFGGEAIVRLHAVGGDGILAWRRC